MTALTTALTAADLTIADIRARAVIAPLRRPIRTASGAIEASPLLLLDVLTEQGVTGSAYLFAYTPLMLGPLQALLAQLTPLLRGQPVVPVARQQQLEQQFRLLGLQGLLGMVVSTLDMALWDGLGKAAKQPVVRLLGGEPKPVRAYDSWGLVDPVRDAAALENSVAQGFTGIKIKLGGGDLAHDLHTVREVRRIVGEDIALMVDYNQSLQPGEAIRRMHALPLRTCQQPERCPAGEAGASATSTGRRTRSSGPGPCAAGPVPTSPCCGATPPMACPGCPAWARGRLPTCCEGSPTSTGSWRWRTTRSCCAG